MKLPQIGYPTFDINLTCSKCGNGCRIDLEDRFDTPENTRNFVSNCCGEKVLGNGSPLEAAELRHYYKLQESYYQEDGE